MKESAKLPFLYFPSLRRFLEDTTAYHSKEAEVNDAPKVEEGLLKRCELHLPVKDLSYVIKNNIDISPPGYESRT